MGIGVAWVRIAFIALTVPLRRRHHRLCIPVGVHASPETRWRLRLAQCPLIRRRLREAISHLPPHDDESAAALESLSEAIQRAPKPAVVALAGFALMATGLLLTSTGADVQIVFPLLVGWAASHWHG